MRTRKWRPIALPWRSCREKYGKSQHLNIRVPQADVHGSLQHLGFVLCDQVEDKYCQEPGSTCASYLLSLEAWPRAWETQVNLYNQRVSSRSSCTLGQTEAGTRSPHGAETVSGLPSPPLERTLVLSNRPNNRPNCTSCVQRRERKLRLYDVTCLQLEEGCSTVQQPKQPDLSVWVPALCQPVRR